MITDYKFLWLIEEDGVEKAPNKKLFDTYVECYENIITQYLEYRKKAKIYLVEVDEEENIVIVKLLKVFS